MGSPGVPTAEAVLHQGPSHGTVVAVPLDAKVLNVDLTDGSRQLYRLAFVWGGRLHFCHAGAEHGPARMVLEIP